MNPPTDVSNRDGREGVGNPSLIFDPFQTTLDWPPPPPPLAADESEPLAETLFEAHLSWMTWQAETMQRVRQSQQAAQEERRTLQEALRRAQHEANLARRQAQYYQQQQQQPHPPVPPEDPSAGPATSSSFSFSQTGRHRSPRLLPPPPLLTSSSSSSSAAAAAAATVAARPSLFPAPAASLSTTTQRRSRPTTTSTVPRGVALRARYVRQQMRTLVSGAAATTTTEERTARSVALSPPAHPLPIADTPADPVPPSSCQHRISGSTCCTTRPCTTTAPTTTDDTRRTASTELSLLLLLPGMLDRWLAHWAEPEEPDDPHHVLVVDDDDEEEEEEDHPEVGHPPDHFHNNKNDNEVEAEDEIQYFYTHGLWWWWLLEQSWWHGSGSHRPPSTAPTTTATVATSGPDTSSESSPTWTIPGTMTNMWLLYCLHHVLMTSPDSCRWILQQVAAAGSTWETAGATASAPEAHKTGRMESFSSSRPHTTTWRPVQRTSCIRVVHADTASPNTTRRPTHTVVDTGTNRPCQHFLQQCRRQLQDPWWQPSATAASAAKVRVFSTGRTASGQAPTLTAPMERLKAESRPSVSVQPQVCREWIHGLWQCASHHLDETRPPELPVKFSASIQALHMLQTLFSHVGDQPTLEALIHPTPGPWPTPFAHQEDSLQSGSSAMPVATSLLISWFEAVTLLIDYHQKSLSSSLLLSSSSSWSSSSSRNQTKNNSFLGTRRSLKTDLTLAKDDDQEPSDPEEAVGSRPMVEGNQNSTPPHGSDRPSSCLQKHSSGRRALKDRDEFEFCMQWMAAALNVLVTWWKKDTKRKENWIENERARNLLATVLDIMDGILLTVPRDVHKSGTTPAIQHYWDRPLSLECIHWLQALLMMLPAGMTLLRTQMATNKTTDELWHREKSAIAVAIELLYHLVLKQHEADHLPETRAANNKLNPLRDQTIRFLHGTLLWVQDERRHWERVAKYSAAGDKNSAFPLKIKVVSFLHLVSEVHQLYTCAASMLLHASTQQESSSCTVGVDVADMLRLQLDELIFDETEYDEKAFSNA